MRPATIIHRKLRSKLQALTERGVDGEREAARRKLARLERRYDFMATANLDGFDLFGGKFRRSDAARFLCKFAPGDYEAAGFAKWAIENQARIPCAWRNGSELWAEAEPATLAQLKHIVTVILRDFEQLWQQFSVTPGVDGKERGNFLLGLYDGMMSEKWRDGAPLPATVRPKVKRERKRTALAAQGLAIHPYHLALELGRAIRLSTPLDQIVATLSDTLRIDTHRVSCEVET